MAAKEKKGGFVSCFDSWMGKIRRFLSDTAAELRRCSWPTRRQLAESTLLVVVAMVLLALFVWGVDQVAQLLIHWVTVPIR